MTLAIPFAAGLACRPGCNDPHPINPEPGMPCGRVYHECPATGHCCGEDEICGVEGHACGLHDCCFGDKTLASARRKSRAQVTPDEARKLAP